MVYAPSSFESERGKEGYSSSSMSEVCVSCRSRAICSICVDITHRVLLSRSPISTLAINARRENHRVPCKIPSTTPTTTPQGLLVFCRTVVVTNTSRYAGSCVDNIAPAVFWSLPSSLAFSSLSHPRSTPATSSQPEPHLPAEGCFLPKTSQHQASALVEPGHLDRLLPRQT